MRVDRFAYHLPPGRIAAVPAPERTQARLLVVHRERLEHVTVQAIGEQLPPGALLVVNNTRVLPARLWGTKIPTGGRVELLLVRRLGSAEHELGGGVVRAERWLALGRASKPLRPGLHIAVGDELVARIDAPPDEHGLLRVRLGSRRGGEPSALIEAVGKMPLPPYIDRAERPEDRERYQTVYAEVPGAVAAPTAGLHFSESLLGQLRTQGIGIEPVTLHIGPGTFRPVVARDLDEHRMHVEPYEVPEKTAAAIAQARRQGSPVVAVGTTVVRALEASADDARPGTVRAMRGETDLLIQPGYRFRVVDGLLTNFHLPRSTLLALVCAFAGTDRVLGAYREAVRLGYRFYSYGDAMLLPRCLTR